MNYSATAHQKNFADVPSVGMQRSTFDRSHEYITTLDEGVLVPILVDEGYPGDTFTCNFQNVVRMATPIFPLMSPIWLDIHFFAVPHRLIWNNWVKFMGEQSNPGDPIADYTVPIMDTVADGFAENSMGDYFGLPTKINDLEDISALPFRASNFIWNFWYRDENLQDRVTVNHLNGPDDIAWFALNPRGKRKDYFTSGLPFPQKGEAVTMPLGISAPVISTGDGIPLWEVDSETGRQMQIDNGSAIEVSGTGASNDTPVMWDDPKLITDLTLATSATINSLRTAFAIQELFEKDARGGTRYQELVRQHFQVTSPDARMNNPEYLGGGSQLITATQVAQTSETGTSPQGNLSAYVQSEGSIQGFNHSVTEHCTIMGFASIRGPLIYQQGINRMWTRQVREDFYFPSLANLGEQAILNREIYAQGDSNDLDVFAYQERWSEMRYFPGLVTGKMRSNATGTTDVWHLAQNFGELPVLNAGFIEEQPPIDRVIAVPSEPHFLMSGWFDYKCTRPMPTYSVPGLSRTL